MNQADEKAVGALLKRAIRPTCAPDLERDLWPQMLQRLGERSAAVPWFDWALLGALSLWLCLSPQTIPLLLYHL